MSTAAAIHRVVGFDAVLGHYDKAPVAKGRTRCPVHDGRNPYAFSVRANEWGHCFNCGFSGGVIELEAALGGGTREAAERRLCERYGITPQPEDKATVTRRRRRWARLNRWFHGRLQQWGQALYLTEAAVAEWQCDPAAADEAWWDELDARCTARDRSEAMFETYRGLRSDREVIHAYKVEQRGNVTLPWEAAE